MMMESGSTSLKHVAIIMDGNGRWAKSRAHMRVWGHVRGARIVSDIVEEADNYGIEALTLYAFSSENWSRPIKEVKTLFSLLKKFLLRERDRILANQIRFKVMGDIEPLPEETKTLIKNLERDTKNFEGLKLTFAFGYGGRNEIVSSVNKHILENPGVPLTKEDIARNLLVPDIGDVDLLIRTGGDYRISNFLLWQVAYAELFFTPTKWPDFTRYEFRHILDSVSRRERRFGGVYTHKDFEDISKLATENKSHIRQEVEVN